MTSSNMVGEPSLFASDSANVESIVKAAIKQCVPGLDRKLQELTRQGTATSWQVEGDIAQVTRTLAGFISAASDDTPEGGEIVVALLPLSRSATVSSLVAGSAYGLPRTLVLAG